MTQWFPLFLLLHVLAAIVAFGPVFSFPLIARMGAAERQHVNFSVRVSAAISKRITIPAALTMPVSGALMVWATGIAWSQLWLSVAIVLYVIAIGYAVLVQGPTVERLVALTSGGPGGPAAPTAPTSAGAPAAPASAEAAATSASSPTAPAAAPTSAGAPAAPASAEAAATSASSPTAPAAAPAGPPPELAATIQKVQRGGMLLTVLILVIVSLMVARPTI